MNKYVFAAALLFSLPAFADDKPIPCNMQDPASTCPLVLTTREIATINEAFQNAEMAQVKWAPVWDRIVKQIAAQQPKAPPEKK